jgi:hypothetical protein
MHNESKDQAIPMRQNITTYTSHMRLMQTYLRGPAYARTRASTAADVVVIPEEGSRTTSNHTPPTLLLHIRSTRDLAYAFHALHIIGADAGSKVSALCPAVEQGRRRRKLIGSENDGEMIGSENDGQGKVWLAYEKN